MKQTIARDPFVIMNRLPMSPSIKGIHENVDTLVYCSHSICTITVSTTQLYQRKHCFIIIIS